MKQTLFFLMLIALGAGAAYWIGAQMPDEAVMSLVGILCGIIASIPLSVLLLAALTRDRGAYVSAPDVTETVSASASEWIVTAPEAQVIDAPTVRQLKP